MTDLPGEIALARRYSRGCLGHFIMALIFMVRLLRSQRRPKPPVKLDNRAPAGNAAMLCTANTGVTMLSMIQIATYTCCSVLACSSGRIDDDWDIVGCDVGQGDMFRFEPVLPRQWDRHWTRRSTGTAVPRGSKYRIRGCSCCYPFTRRSRGGVGVRARTHPAQVVYPRH